MIGCPSPCTHVLTAADWFTAPEEREILSPSTFSVTARCFLTPGIAARGGRSMLGDRSDHLHITASLYSNSSQLLINAWLGSIVNKICTINWSNKIIHFEFELVNWGEL